MDMDTQRQNISGSSGRAASTGRNSAPPSQEDGAVGNAAKDTTKSAPQQESSATDAFDMSSYDPLQAYVNQLTASAGYTNNGDGSPSFTPSPAPEQVVISTDSQRQQRPPMPQSQTDIATQQQQQLPQSPPQQPQHYFAVNGGAAGAPVPLPAVSQPVLQPAVTVSADVAPVPAVPVPNTTTTSTSHSLFGSIPSVISASTIASNFSAAPVPPSSLSSSSQDFLCQQKRPAQWQTMSAEEKRRYERNMREQQRSHQISHQIKELRSLLQEAKVPFKPNKYSILCSVSEYLKQLQARAIMLDAEHRKLIETMRQTNDMVNSGQMPDLEDVSNNAVGNDAEMLLVQGLNYRLVFDQCSAALGVSSLDGRILDCNMNLLSMFGCSRETVLTRTIFDLVQSHEEVYQAMGDMLKSEAASSSSSSGSKRTADDMMSSTSSSKPPLYWSGLVSQNESTKLVLNISLARTPDGVPKFFNFALTTA